MEPTQKKPAPSNRTAHRILRSQQNTTVLVPLCGNFGSRMGGRNYAETLLSEIQKDDRGLRWIIGAKKSLIHALADHGSKVQIEWITFPDWSDSSLGRLLFEQLRLPFIIRALQPTVVYFSGNFSTVLSRVPSVLAVRSLLEYKMPDEVRFVRRVLRKSLVRTSISKAHGIISPSSHLAREIEQRFHVPAERIHTVRHGINPAYQTAPQDDRILDQLNLRGRPYFLYPASLWPYKNHMTLIQACRELTGESKKASIVFAGHGTATNATYKTRLGKAITEVSPPTRIILTGELEARQLSALYSNASATLFPSTCESFGNPIVEAMSQGCPIVTSNRDALPEIVDSGGIILDPFDVHAWAREMSRLVNDPEYHDHWSREASRRTTIYDSSAAVDSLVDVLRSATTPWLPAGTT